MTRNSTGRRTADTCVLGTATIATGLMAGVFSVFACAVMPALARSEDAVYVEVVRNINDVIQNPVFLLAFLGAPLLTGVSAWRLRGEPCRWWVWAALVAYGLALLVTVAVNVPLNDGLASSGAPPALVRERFEDRWTAWNVVRAVLSTLALACLTRALVRYGRQTSAYLVSAAGSRASR
ncbi:anthrone oxygenase family protein [Streptomyces chromofuscus]|uniref:DUF1772 domain-containing protein n=1 Tax=Streptomyces chromofuscus TaxID=42881 RepID=A0A7M2TFL9_STRCW|nr:anthrone oxygenase family protein [Streptomyces chromofuscus]QOV46949.1 DUF1772 domain-containing protein [Streptomyces chromofuscus]GGT14773.1 membrane protein [Streptomyces chromofuscus]